MFNFPVCGVNNTHADEYQVDVCADVDTARCVPEPVEGNNRYCERITVRDPKADLVVSEIELINIGVPANCVDVPAQEMPSVCAGMKVTVTNAGDARADGIRAPLYRHVFGFPSGDRVDFGNPLSFNLNPGQLQDVTYNGWFPVSGNYFMEVIVDPPTPLLPNGSIIEYNENNNDVQRDIPELEAVDIKVEK